MRRLALLAATGALALGTAAYAEIPPEQETEHVVQEGETLGGIANRAQVPRILIAEANGLKPPYAVRAGQKLKIPRTRHHTVKAGETGFDIAYQYAVPWKDIAVANGIDPGKPVKVGQALLIPTLIATPDAAATKPAAATTAASAASTAKLAWPVAGTVRRGFTARGAGSPHDGIDITAAAGTAVRSAAAGKVIFAGTKGDYGNLVVVEHGPKLHTAYGFLSQITVKPGEQVNRGERIGMVGRTGLAKGDELHFEVRRSDKPVDPKGELESK